MTTIRITVERMQLADDARGLARKVRKLVKRAGRVMVDIRVDRLVHKRVAGPLVRYRDDNGQG